MIIGATVLIHGILGPIIPEAAMTLMHAVFR